MSMFTAKCRPLGSFVIPQFGGKDGLLSEVSRGAVEVYSPVESVRQFEPTDDYSATWVCPDCLCEPYGPFGLQRGCPTCGDGKPRVTSHKTSRGPDFETESNEKPGER